MANKMLRNMKLLYKNFIEISKERDSDRPIQITAPQINMPEGPWQPWVNQWMWYRYQKMLIKLNDSRIEHGEIAKIAGKAAAALTPIFESNLNYFKSVKNPVVRKLGGLIRRGK